uniref:major facilitator superfamily domain-containing protein 8-like n=1 Tax=Euleptes europaea TaxID=460621 RepID=UPI00253FB2AA|nr:major facilitator superfamily domain-containing protein 8-like [Euleptes europaea]
MTSRDRSEDGHVCVGRGALTAPKGKKGKSRGAPLRMRTRLRGSPTEIILIKGRPGERLGKRRLGKRLGKRRRAEEPGCGRYWPPASADPLPQPAFEVCLRAFDLRPRPSLPGGKGETPDAGCMDYQRKKKLTNFTIGLLFLAGGIEYAVILPTIWAYLRTLDAEPYFLGLAISAFSFAGLITGPLFGYWSDRTRQTKAIILFANLFQIAGNFMYFVGSSKWMILSSRLVAGVGTGAGASIFGYLTRSTTLQERATVFAAVMACRQVGLLIGPACNLFLCLFDFPVGPFVANKYTSPGIFMCLVWLLLQFIVMTMYYDLPLSPPACPERVVPTSSDILEEEEEEPLMRHEAGQEEAVETGSYGSTCAEPLGDECRYVSNGHLADEEAAKVREEKGPFGNFSAWREYLREEVVVLLTAQFITLFNQTALETMVTPITQRYLNFGELENSLMYFLCCVEVICGFFLVRCLSSRLKDRVILVVGLVICNVACVWCLVFLGRPQGSFAVLLTELVVGVFLQVLGLPFVAVSQVSLFSKVTAERTQGFSQGLRRSVGGIATILGPLWAGSLTENLYIMLGAMMVLLTLLMIMVGLSYAYLVEPAGGGVPSEAARDEYRSSRACRHDFLWRQAYMRSVIREHGWLWNLNRSPGSLPPSVREADNGPTDLGRQAFELRCWTPAQSTQASPPPPAWRINPSERGSALSRMTGR